MTPGNILAVDRCVAENIYGVSVEWTRARNTLDTSKPNCQFVPMRCLFETTFTVGQTTYLPCARFRILTHCLVLAWKWRDTQISGFVPVRLFRVPKQKEREEKKK